MPLERFWVKHPGKILRVLETALPGVKALLAFLSDLVGFFLERRRVLKQVQLANEIGEIGRKKDAGNLLEIIYLTLFVHGGI